MTEQQQWREKWNREGKVTGLIRVQSCAFKDAGVLWCTSKASESFRCCCNGTRGRPILILPCPPATVLVSCSTNGLFYLVYSASVLPCNCVVFTLLMPMFYFAANEFLIKHTYIKGLIPAAKYFFNILLLVCILGCRILYTNFLKTFSLTSLKSVGEVSFENYPTNKFYLSWKISPQNILLQF